MYFHTWEPFQLRVARLHTQYAFYINYLDCYMNCKVFTRTSNKQSLSNQIGYLALQIENTKNALHAFSYLGTIPGQDPIRKLP